MKTQQTPAPSAETAGSAKFFAAKIAFEIPEKYEAEGDFTRAVPDELIRQLMDLFEDCEFEGAAICSPPLLVVSPDEMPTREWIAEAEKRINGVLQNSVLSNAPEQP